MSKIILNKRLIYFLKNRETLKLIASAFLGGLMTIAFAPLLQRIEFGYWQRKFEKETKRYLIEKRIETIQEFKLANSEVKYCFDTAITKAKESDNPDSFLLAKLCRKEMDGLWNAGFKATVYTDKETNKELQNLNTLINMLVFKTALSPFRTEDYQENLNNSADKVLELMQTNLSNFE